MSFTRRKVESRSFKHFFKVDTRLNNSGMTESPHFEQDRIYIHALPHTESHI